MPRTLFIMILAAPKPAAEKRFLAGKTALVTGATRGIGLAVARGLGAAGARVAIHDLAREDQARAAENDVRAAGAPASRFFAADLRDEAAVDAMVDAVLGWAGAVDVLVNNAGMQHTAALPAMPPQVWNDILAVNLSAAFHTMRRLLPGTAERGYGRVVSIASVHGLVASGNKAPYVASKFGLVGLTRVAALEYAATGSRETGGVTVNCICPGWTETAIIEPQIEARAAEAGGDRAAGIQALLREKQPSLRTSLPDEIAALALWLCAPAAHNVRASPSQSMAAGPRSSYLVRMRPRAVEQWRPSLREACHLADPHVGSPP